MAHIPYADCVAPDQNAPSVQSHPRDTSLSYDKKMGLIDTSADSVALGTDCGDGQTNYELHCPHISEYPF